MLHFPRIEAGIYQAFYQNTKLNINRQGVSYWALLVEGEFIEAYKTLSDAKVAANQFCGITTNTPIAPQSPKAPKLPAIMHNYKGLYIFGLDEICAILEGQTDIPGVCRPHETKRGAKGYFLDIAKSKEFWLLSAEPPFEGTKVLCIEGRQRVEVTL